MAPLLGYFDHSRGSVKHSYKDMTCVTDPTLQVAVLVDTKSVSFFRMSSTLDLILFQILVHD